jgi:hypothetical protein
LAQPRKCNVGSRFICWWCLCAILVATGIHMQACSRTRMTPNNSRTATRSHQPGRLRLLQPQHFPQAPIENNMSWYITTWFATRTSTLNTRQLYTPPSVARLERRIYGCHRSFLCPRYSKSASSHLQCNDFSMITKYRAIRRHGAHRFQSNAQCVDIGIHRRAPQLHQLRVDEAASSGS